MTEPLYIEHEEAVARIVLNRPAVGNTIDEAMAEAFASAASDLATASSVRVVVLTGAGALFCGGGDVRAMASAPDGASAVIDRITSNLHRGILILAEMQKPLVSIVNGPAAGAGLGLAILGDIVIASDTAHFTSAYTAIGMTPDGGTSWLLPRLIGLRLALDMVLTNRRIPADEAAKIGLVTRVVPHTELGKAERELTTRLDQGSIVASGRARWLLATSFDRSLAVHLALEAGAIADSAAGQEGQEGIAKFLARTR